MNVFEVINEEPGKLNVVVQIGFKYNFKKQPPEVFNKRAVLTSFTIIIGKHLCWGLSLIKLQANRPAKKGIQQRCFHVYIAKFFRTPILKKIYERLLLNFIAPNEKVSALHN